MEIVLMQNFWKKSVNSVLCQLLFCQVCIMSTFILSTLFLSTFIMSTFILSTLFLSTPYSVNSVFHLISQDSTNHTTYYNALCSALQCRVQCSAAATWRGESRCWLQWPTDARPCQTSPLTSVIAHLHLTNWILSFTTRLWFTSELY